MTVYGFHELKEGIQGMDQIQVSLTLIDYKVKVTKPKGNWCY